MRKGTLARAEIFLGLFAFAAVLALAGFGLVSSLAARLDPRVRICVERSMKSGLDGRPMSRLDATALCKHLEADGALR